MKSKKLKPGSQAQKLIDPKGYQSYITARDKVKIKDVDFDDIFSLTTSGVNPSE